MNNTLKSAAMIILSTVLCLCACDIWDSNNGGGNNDTVEPPKIWGIPGLIEFSSNDTLNHQITIDNDGNAFVVWVQSDDTRYNIWSKRYTDSSGWEAAQLVENDNTGGANFPQISVDHKGNAFSVWHQTDGTRNNILANRYTAGSTWGTAVPVEYNNEGNAYRPQIAVDPNGNAITVWFQHDGTRHNIWANRYTEGSGWGTAQLIETGSYDATGSIIAVDPNGNAFAVWRQYDGTMYNIWSNRYTVGSGWGTAQLIENDNSGNADVPQIAVDHDGNAIVVWKLFDGTRSNIWTNRYTMGSGWGTVQLIETDDEGNAYEPQIAVDPNGNAIVVFYQYDGIKLNIKTNRYTAGSGWGTPELIETNDEENAYNPQIAINSDSNAIAVWRQNDGTRYNIWANRYTAGSGWGTAELIETDDTGDAEDPQIAFDNEGNAIAVWRQFDGSYYSIYACRYE